MAEAQAAIHMRVAHYIDALRGGAGHFNAAPQTDRESWRIYAESLDLRRRYPGINGIGIIFREFNQPDWLDPKATTLPRLLKSVGYTTGHFGKWHLSGTINDAPLPPPTESMSMPYS